ncbi:hypothetical protein B0H10DRAFT_1811711, partial [Mycena sp. CBHHK59/15]
MDAPSLRARILDLDAAIIQQKLVLEKIDADRRSVQLQLDTVTYPLLTLPNEITSEIFMHCLPAELEQPRQSQAPILFLRICRAWREIARSTPGLW